MRKMREEAERQQQRQAHIVRPPMPEPRKPEPVVEKPKQEPKPVAKPVATPKPVETQEPEQPLNKAARKNLKKKQEKEMGIPQKKRMQSEKREVRFDLDASDEEAEDNKSTGHHNKEQPEILGFGGEMKINALSGKAKSRARKRLNKQQEEQKKEEEEVKFKTIQKREEELQKVKDAELKEREE
jgi:hypothetical protein